MLGWTLKASDGIAQGKRSGKAAERSPGLMSVVSFSPCKGGILYQAPSGHGDDWGSLTQGGAALALGYPMEPRCGSRAEAASSIPVQRAVGRQGKPKHGRSPWHTAETVAHGRRRWHTVLGWTLKTADGKARGKRSGNAAERGPGVVGVISFSP